MPAFFTGSPSHACDAMSHNRAAFLVRTQSVRSSGGNAIATGPSVFNSGSFANESPLAGQTSTPLPSAISTSPERRNAAP